MPTPEQTIADAIPGTPPYIAPERLGDPRNIDCRSDLYSLGAVAFNLLTGKPLFEGNSAMDIAYKVVANPAPRLSEFVEDGRGTGAAGQRLPGA